MILRRLPGEVGSEETALGIGVFDGLHRGHQMLVAEVQRAAIPNELIPSILTFDPPPPVMLREAGFRPLMTLAEKTSSLRNLGIEILYVLQFTREIAAFSAPSFIESILQWVHPRVIIVGENFYFGCSRQGNAQTLVEEGHHRGFEVHVLPLLEDVEMGTISSSHIRQLLAKGEIHAANSLLGRPYQVSFAQEEDLEFYRVEGEEKLMPPDGHYLLRIEGTGGLVRGTMQKNLLKLSGPFSSHLSISFLERLKS